METEKHEAQTSVTVESATELAERNERNEGSEKETPMSTGGSDDSNATSESEIDSSARDILSYHVKGCWGTLERIPLNMKLLAVSAFSIIGLMVFGIWLIVVSGNALTTYQIATKFQELMTPLQSVATALGIERAATTSWVTNPSASSRSSMDTTRGETDTAWNVMQPIALSLQDEKSLDVLTKDYVQNIATLRSQLLAFRTNIVATPDFETVLKFFADTIESLLIVQQRLCSQVASNIDQCYFHSYLLRMDEQTGVSRASGVVLTNLGDSTPLPVREYFKNSIQFENLYYLLLFTSAQGNQQNLIKQVFSDPAVTKLDTIRKNYTSWLAGLSPRPTYTDSFYIDAVTTRIGWIVDRIAIPVENSLLSSNAAAFGAAIGLVIAVVVSCIGCFMLSCCVTFVFSKTITGPWQRMLELQQKVMNMFVPRSMLSMMKIKNMSQLTYGYHVAKKVGVLTSIIVRENSFNSTKMLPTEQLEFFNNFLSSIGGVIRSNGGYIHKHLDAEGFVAVFTSNSDAIRATIAVHEMTDMVLNKQNDNFPTITLHSGLCHGDAVFGTIGESRRMDISVLSECTRISKTLASMNKTYRTHILTTKESLAGVKKKQIVSSRALAKIKQYGREYHVHELFHSSKLELVNSRELFNAATSKFYSFQFSEARTLYEEILQSSPHDHVTRHRLAECTRMIFFNQNQKNEMNHAMNTIYNVLQSPVMFEAFEQFTKKEKSHENIRLYYAIQDYKVSPKSRRYSATKALYKEFLDESSHSMVNVNDKYRIAVKEALEKAVVERESTFSKVVGILTDSLFDDLIAAIEFNMLDTFERFKATNEAREALMLREIVHETVHV